MRSISEIIRDLRQCIGTGCEGCIYRDATPAEALPFCGNCCARYAEEIMMLQERLKEANHE